MKKNQFWQTEYERLLEKRKQKGLSKVENENLRDLSKVLFAVK